MKMSGLPIRAKLPVASAAMLALVGAAQGLHHDVCLAKDIENSRRGRYSKRGTAVGSKLMD